MMMGPGTSATAAISYSESQPPVGLLATSLPQRAGATAAIFQSTPSRGCLVEGTTGAARTSYLGNGALAGFVNHSASMCLVEDAANNDAHVVGIGDLGSDKNVSC